MRISAILLSGGTGSRMQSDKPKQYLFLKGKPIVLHSFDILRAMPNISEIIVVCDEKYRDLFPLADLFAPAGIRRQDSVYNALQLVSSKTDFVLIHDGARPFISPHLVQRVIDGAKNHGAAACGVPLKYTIKETKEDNFVAKTHDRQLFWEIQTPQVVRCDLLKIGFEIVHSEGLTVTDDVSLVELFHPSVKIVEGSAFNLKITTPEDLIVAESYAQI